ncbi:MAG: hypothetical protein ACK4I8_08250, partial [Armatimonadota bacterium]
KEFNLRILENASSDKQIFSRLSDGSSPDAPICCGYSREQPSERRLFSCQFFVSFGGLIS